LKYSTVASVSYIIIPRLTTLKRRNGNYIP
jgi:hypothetical protein